MEQGSRRCVDSSGVVEEFSLSADGDTDHRALTVHKHSRGVSPGLEGFCSVSCHRVAWSMYLFVNKEGYITTASIG